jgi:hypothetical protein
MFGSGLLWCCFDFSSNGFLAPKASPRIDSKFGCKALASHEAPPLGTRPFLAENVRKYTRILHIWRSGQTQESSLVKCLILVFCIEFGTLCHNE